MNNVEIQTAVLAILIPFLKSRGTAAAPKAEDTAWDNAGKLYQLIKSRFAQDEYTQQTLARFEAEPGQKKGSFQAVLGEILELDDGFGNQLQILIAADPSFNKDSQFTTLVFDEGKVGQIINAETIMGNISHSTSSRADTTPDQISELNPHYGLLYRNLTTYFSHEELRELTFFLNIDYENLRDQTKTEMARSLILYCDRHQRIDELIARCRQLRPKISDWLGSDTAA